jgi:hypothetical protein
MATNHLAHMDPSILGGDLEKLIRQHWALCKADDEARVNRDRAEKAVTNAEAANIAQAAAARLTGDAEPDTEPEKAAAVERDLAEREKQIAALAVLKSIDAITDELTRNYEKYAARLDKATEASRLAALNAMDKGESALAGLQTARSYRKWLDRPGGGGSLRSPTQAEAFSDYPAVTRPSGEPTRVSDLTAAIHTVLDPPSRPPGDQRGGIPLPEGEKKAAPVGRTFAPMYRDAA